MTTSHAAATGLVRYHCALIRTRAPNQVEAPKKHTGRGMDRTEYFPYSSAV